MAFDDQVDYAVKSERWRAAYAESVDGVKPELDLVEFRGSKKNNLVDVGGAWGFFEFEGDQG